MHSRIRVTSVLEVPLLHSRDRNTGDWRPARAIRRRASSSLVPGSSAVAEPRATRRAALRYCGIRRRAIALSQRSAEPIVGGGPSCSAERYGTQSRNPPETACAPAPDGPFAELARQNGCLPTRSSSNSTRVDYGPAADQPSRIDKPAARAVLVGRRLEPEVVASSQGGTAAVKAPFSAPRSSVDAVEGGDEAWSLPAPRTSPRTPSHGFLRRNRQARRGAGLRATRPAARGARQQTRAGLCRWSIGRATQTRRDPAHPFCGSLAGQWEAGVVIRVGASNTGAGSGAIAQSG
jgi:hypothetical protein